MPASKPLSLRPAIVLLASAMALFFAAQASATEVAKSPKNAGTTMAVDGESVYWVDGGKAFRSSAVSAGVKAKLPGSGNKNVKQLRAGGGSVAFLTYELRGWKGIFTVFRVQNGKTERVLTTTRKWTPSRLWCGESAKLLGVDPDGTLLLARSSGGGKCKQAATSSLWRLSASQPTKSLAKTFAGREEIVAASGNLVATKSKSGVKVIDTPSKAVKGGPYAAGKASKEFSFDATGHVVLDNSVDATGLDGAGKQWSYRSCGRSIVRWLDAKKGAGIAVVGNPVDANLAEDARAVQTAAGSVRAFSCDGRRIAYVLAKSTSPGAASKVIVEQLDMKPPRISLTAPMNDLKTTGSSTQVVFTAEDGTTPANEIACRISNNNVLGQAISSGAAVALGMGSNSLAVVCTDALQNGGSSSALLVSRGSVPQIVITSPANGANVTSPVSVGFTVDGGAIPSGTICKVNGVNSVSPALVTLTTGPSKPITVSCENAYGTNSESVNVTVGIAPDVDFTTNGGNDITTGLDEYTFTYTESGTATVTCSLTNNGSTSGVTGDHVEFVPGANLIVVTCSNSFGVASDSMTVTYED